MELGRESEIVAGADLLAGVTVLVDGDDLLEHGGPLHLLESGGRANPG
jgi:hypothetical protein